ISKDGVFYIERAQGLSSDPIRVAKEHPPGYPFLIFAGHKLVTLFTDHSSAFTWIYSAQSTTLLFRLLALVPLYLIGRLLVGSRRSFYAMLILVLLPHPAKMASDVVRMWPYLLFLSTGFLFLLYGSRRGQWWMFGAAGLAAGVGHIVRPECAQLVIIGVLWILIRLLRPERNMDRIALTYALSVLLIGFAIPTAPYAKVTGRILPRQLKTLMSYSSTSEPDQIQGMKTDGDYRTYTASALPGRIAEATGKFVERISENLMYYFVPALAIGMYTRVGKRSAASDVEKFFIPVFVALNMIMTVTVYCRWQYMSRRHCLPVVAFTIFYVPVGLEVLARWLKAGFSRGRSQANRHQRLFFFVLLVIGGGICMPRLLRPTGADKRGYRDAAEWLRSNADAEDVIAVTDSRISFYAERKWLLYEVTLPDRADYVVRIVDDRSEEVSPDRSAQEVYSTWVDKQKKSKKRLFILKM
ncbi:MAG: glycosyltransferase family 39 protein, partial [Planctomycetota bacterium]